MFRFQGKLTKGSDHSAGLDLYCTREVVLHPQTFCFIETGVFIEDCDNNYFGLVKDRSGYAGEGLRIGAGVIDPDYRGEIKVLVHNISFKELVLKPDRAIAQIIFVRFQPIDMESILGERGDAGFNSSSQS